MIDYFYYCVNALNGLTSFLLSDAQMDAATENGVNALNGLTSFLHAIEVSMSRIDYVCQCPKRANFISTKIAEVCKSQHGVCQCPKRANFISTKQNYLQRLK